MARPPNRPPPGDFAVGSGWGSVPAAILVDHTEDENLVGAQIHERLPVRTDPLASYGFHPTRTPRRPAIARQRRS